MMNSFDTKPVKEIFCRLFVLAIQNKVNFLAFTKALERSEFVYKIEDGKYDEYFHKSLIDIFYDITKMQLNEDTSFGIYNDAYWCGHAYFELHQKTERPFVYIFLKLPLSKMIDLYSIYHEMDFSSLLAYFDKVIREKTILRLLCEEKKCSLSELSESTCINKATLAKYNSADEYLFKGSFQYIYRLSLFFDAPLHLFFINFHVKNAQ